MRVTTSISKHEEHDGVVQYLGVKYASLEHKFAQAQMCEYPSIDGLGAATHGPSAVSPPQACEFEFGLIQKSLPITEFPQSDTNCLNLNITAPAGVRYGESRLPVFVFIHGGGFSIGSNAWPQYDHERIVRLSSDMGMPMIGVGINYRLGPFGFLTSGEMRDFGFCANNALRDQHVALLWIQKHISLYGGDPSRVTCIGESAGAVSTMHQVQLPIYTPPFQQLVSMSGSPLMMRPLPGAVAEGIYQSVIGILGLHNLSAAERKSALLSIPASELLSKLPPGLPFLPVLDGDSIREDVSFSGLKSGSEVTQRHDMKLLIGSCDMDASVFGALLASKQAGCLKSFIAVLNEVIPEHAQDLLSAYQMTETMNNDDAWLAILNFANDISFHAPASAYASTWSSDVYQYRFKEPNTWEGPWQGYSTHVLDVAYLFLNYTEHLTPTQAEVARDLASDMVKFINGKPPFESIKQGSGFVKEYLSTDGKASSKAYQGAHTYPLLFSRIGYDTLSAVWAGFMSS